ncbi:MAG TPA: chemotaxis protein CheX [Polyangiaceae bacterium]
MTIPNHEIELRIGGLGAEACTELFTAYGVGLAPTRKDWGATDERMLSGSIGFVGRHVRGTCLLATTEAPLRRSCPTGGKVRDWIGELTNQFVGRLKSKLLGCGVEVFVTTPIVLSGVRIQPLPRGRLEPFVFSSSDGDVLVWVEVDVDEGFVLGSLHPGRSNAEGQVILF